jgi:hypothetical protein
MVIKYNNIFHSKALQILPKSGFFVRKQTIWQPCLNYGKIWRRGAMAIASSGLGDRGSNPAS